MAAPEELNVTLIPPPQRHATIFKVFDNLEPGSSFILVNDHRPTPLRFQFDRMREGAFEWQYLEDGPAIWKVQITRTN